MREEIKKYFTSSKRKVELDSIKEWVERGSSVLDLGCGRGILLEKLVEAKGIYGVGIDSDADKISRAIKRGLSVMQCDICEALATFKDKSFDWAVCSRTLPELENPKKVVLEAIRVADRVAVGFINYGFWVNRRSYLLHGRRVVNQVYPETWAQSRPTNPISVASFKEFCKSNDIKINREHYLDGSWRKPCRFLPNLFSGYAIFEITSK